MTDQAPHYFQIWLEASIAVAVVSLLCWLVKEVLRRTR